MDPLAEPDAAIALARLIAADGAASANAAARVPDDAWPALADAARAHGLGALLYRSFGAAHACPAVAAALAPLRPAYLHTLGANLRAAEQLAAVLAALAGRGVPAALLKGAHLLFGAYADAGDRPMSDLDLLVEPDRVAEAADALRATGLEPQGAYTLESQFQLMAHLPPFVAPGRLPVELHWRLLRPTEPYRVDVPALLARARPLPRLGAHARALDPADAFLHLALHAIVKDRLADGLRPLVDCARLFAAAPDDASWAQAADRARAAGAARVHDLALALFGAVFGPGARLPQGLTPAGPPPDPGVLASARALLLDPAAGDPAVAPNLARAFASSPRGAARLVLARLFPARHELDVLETAPDGARSYPARLARRWGTLLSRHGADGWALLRRGADERAQAARSERGRAVAAWCAGIMP